MRYRMKEKIFSFTDQFTIEDAQGRPVYEVKGKLLSLGDRLRFYDLQGNELAFIKQELISLKPRYRIYRDDELQAEISKKLFSLFRERFNIEMEGETPDLEIKGNILDHEYRFLQSGREVAHVSKKWFSLRDSYGVDVGPDVDDVLVLACAVVIDLISHEPEND
ncbi:MAG: LURP-one-related/scramblase family protein [Anaerolineales bacterium]